MMIFGKEKDSVKTDMFLPIVEYKWKIDDFIYNNRYSNVLLYSFSAENSELFEVQRCFNSTTHIFAFGHDVGNDSLTVNLIFMMGDGCISTNRATLDELRRQYNDTYRIYSRSDPLSIQLGDYNAFGYLVGMEIGNVDPNKQLCTITLTFKVDEEA